MIILAKDKTKLFNAIAKELMLGVNALGIENVAMLLDELEEELGLSKSEEVAQELGFKR